MYKIATCQIKFTKRDLPLNVYDINKWLEIGLTLLNW